LRGQPSETRRCRAGLPDGNTGPLVHQASGHRRPLDVSHKLPKPLAGHTAHGADVVATMGCGDTCPFYPGKRYVEWDLADLPDCRLTKCGPSSTRSTDGQTLVAELMESGRAMISDVPSVTIRPMEPGDWPTVRSIYAAGIATGNATFETSPTTWDQWDTDHRDDLRYVAVDGDRVVGWAAAVNVSDRCCYAGVVENSVYVDPDTHRRGIGRALLDTLIDAATTTGIWTIQTGIFPENTASIALHQACGFRVVGRRERIGQLHGTWRDVLLLERRGTDPA